MKFFKHIVVICVATALLTGCGKKIGKSSVVDQKTIDSLNALMVSNPEFATASLKDIKEAAENNSANVGQPLKMDPMLATAPMEDAPAVPPVPTTPTAPTAPLKQDVAKEAQALIDKILNNFDMSAQLDAEFKVLGIVINMQRSLMKDMEKNRSETNNTPNNPLFQEYGASFDNTLNQMPTCEQFIDKPFGKMSDDQIEDVIKTNAKQLKDNLSGCAKIQGKQFAECIDDFNKMAVLVNENATCSMQNFDELTKMAESEFGKSFKTIQNRALDCFNNQFSKCGFSMQRKYNGKN